MERIKGTPIYSTKNVKNRPSKIQYNGRSGSVRATLPAEAGLKDQDLVKYERMDNGIVLIIPEKIWIAEENE